MRTARGSQIRVGSASEIPYGLTDGGVLDPPPTRVWVRADRGRGYRVYVQPQKCWQASDEPARSGDTITWIFTQQITNSADPSIKADNPPLTLPTRAITPVVRRRTVPLPISKTQLTTD